MYHRAQGNRARGGLEVDTAPQRAVRGREPHTSTRRRPVWASHDAPSHATAQAAAHYIPTEANCIIGRRVVAHGAGLRWIRRRSGERPPPTPTRRRPLWARHNASSHAIAQAAVDYTPAEAQLLIGRRARAHRTGLKWIRRRSARVGGRAPNTTTRRRQLWARHDAPSRAIA